MGVGKGSLRSLSLPWGEVLRISCYVLSRIWLPNSCRHLIPSPKLMIRRRWKLVLLLWLVVRLVEVLWPLIPQKVILNRVLVLKAWADPSGTACNIVLALLKLHNQLLLPSLDIKPTESPSPGPNPLKQSQVFIKLVSLDVFLVSLKTNELSYICLCLDQHCRHHLSYASHLQPALSKSFWVYTHKLIPHTKLLGLNQPPWETVKTRLRRHALCSAEKLASSWTTCPICFSIS